MDTTTLILPKELEETYTALSRRTGRPTADLMRDALEAYAVDESAAGPELNGADDATLPSWIGLVESGPDNENESSEVPEKRFASLGAGESTLDDGYDSTNVKDWIRKTWKPE